MSVLAEQHERWSAARKRLWTAAPVVVRKSPRARIVEIASRVPVVLESHKPLVKSIIELTKPAWAQIAIEVCQKHGVSMVDIVSPRRDVPAVLARHETMYRLKTETTMSLQQIGKRLGDRDHTTVYHGIWKHKQRMDANG